MRRCAKIGKKWLAVLCAVVLFFTSVPMVNDSVMAATLAQTTDYLYLRSGPGTSYSQIMLMEKGITVTILDDTTSSSWVKIETPSGKVGWCSKTYLSYSSVSKTATTTDALNLRSGAGLNYSVLRVLAKGTKLTVLDDTSSSSWVKVKTSAGVSGWCSREYLSISGETAAPTLSLSPTSKTVKEGESFTLTVTATNNGGTVPTASSSNTAVASVKYSKTSSGKYLYTVRGLKAGTATLTIKIGSVSKTMKVTVTEASVSTGNTATTTDALRLRSGAGTSYSVLTVMAAGTKLTVVDGTSNKEWVKVTTSGGLTGWCSREYLVFSNETVTPTLSLSPTSQSIEEGDSFTLTVTATNNGSTIPTISSSNTGVASAAYKQLSNGKYLYTIKGIKAGTATITVKIGSVSKTMKVTVTEAPVPTGNTATTTDALRLRSGAGTSYSVLTVMAAGTKLTVVDGTSNKEWVKVTTSGGLTGWCSREYLVFSNETLTPTLSLSPTSKTIEAKQSFTVTATVTNNGSTIPTVSSSDGKVASASYSKLSDGKYLYTVTGVAAGTATITVKIGTVSQTVKVTVTAPVEEPTGETATTTDVLNLRSGAGTGYPVLKVLPKGTELEVLDKESQSSWVKVKTSDGITGWCSREYLLLSSEGKAPVLTLDLTEKTIRAGNSFTLTATAENCGDSVPTVSSSNEKVASASYSQVSNGKYLYTITGVAAGTATITVKAGSLSQSVKVTVEEEKEPARYARTTTALNLRSGPGTSYSRLVVLASGTLLNVLDTSNPDWTKVSTSSGSYTGYVSTEYIEFVEDVDSCTITLSHTSVSIPAGKTMYTTGTCSVSGMGLIWKSSNESVATVQNGYIYAVAPGTCTVTAQAGSTTVSCAVTVTQAEAVEFAYSDPNIASAGSAVTLTAITNDQRTKVRFAVTVNGVTTNYDVAGYTTETAVTDGLADHTTRVFSKKLTFSTAGTYSVKVYAYTDGVWSSDSKSFTVHVVSTQDAQTASLETRRISDEMLTIISKMEGFSAGVYPDTLAYNIPTMGYGYVIAKGEKFYNNLTKREGWALLCSTINERSYTREVNKFIQNNGLKASQCQFDALVSFSYNVGSGYWNSSSASISMREIMLNSVVPFEVEESGRKGVSTDSFVLYKGAGNSTGVITSYGKSTEVTVYKMEYQEDSRQMWYYLTTSDGKTGWAHGGYICLSGQDLIYDLSYTDSYAFGSAMLEWHKAGGVCLPGLLYRRLAESKVYSFADYAGATPGAADYKVNTYGYTYPGCLASYER